MKILDTQFDSWKLISMTVEHDGKEYRMVDEYLLKCAKESNGMLSNVNADLSERHSKDLEIIKNLEAENKKLRKWIRDECFCRTETAEKIFEKLSSN